MAEDSHKKGELSLLLEHQRELREQLQQCEKLIFDKESEYLESTDYGNIVRGWDGYIDSKPRRDTVTKRAKVSDSDRIFSLSSVTSAVVDPALADHSRGPVDVAGSANKKKAAATTAAAAAAGTRERSTREKRKRKRTHEDDEEAE